MATLNFLQAKEVEWNDQKFYYEGTRVVLLKGLRFGITTDKSHLFAEGDMPFGIQSGNKEPKGSVKVLKSVVDALNAAAVSAGGNDLSDLQGTIVITFKAKGVRPLQTITLVGVEFSAFEYGWDQGAKEMDVELPFLYTDLILS